MSKNTLFRTILLACLFTQQSIIYAQFSLTKENNLPFINDVLKGREIENLNISNQEDTYIWDISQSNISSKETELAFLKKDSSSHIPVLLNNSLFYLQENENNTLDIIEVENHLQKFFYPKAEIAIKYPMAYGDSISDYFYGKGTYCDKLKILNFGKYTLIADKKGKLILPNGDILNDILQVHSRKYASNKWFTSNQSLILPNILTKDSIDIYLQEDSIHLFQDKIYLFAKGYRYPIICKIESWTSPKKSKKHTKIIFFNPYEQNYLALDENNREIRKQQDYENKYNDRSNLSNKDIITYKIMQDKNCKKITILYSLKKEALVEGILADSKGIILRKVSQFQKNGDNYVMVLENKKLVSSNTLIVSLKVNNQLYTEKITNL